LKQRTSLLIVVLFCAATADAYEPLTEAEALQYVRQAPEAAAADVMKLEAIENAVPIVDVPQFFHVVTREGNELVIHSAPRGLLRIDAASVGWTITLPSSETRVVERSRGSPVLLVGAGFTVGALVTLLALLPRL
jgi:hypothetical protein